MAFTLPTNPAFAMPLRTSSALEAIADRLKAEQIDFDTDQIATEVAESVLTEPLMTEEVAKGAAEQVLSSPEEIEAPEIAEVLETAEAPSIASAQSAEKVEPVLEERMRPSEIEADRRRALVLIEDGNRRPRDQIAKFLNAIEITKKIGDLRLRAQALFGLGNCRVHNSAEVFQEALDIAHEINDRQLAIKARIGLGNATKDPNHFLRALVECRREGIKPLAIQTIVALKRDQTIKRASDAEINKLQKIISELKNFSQSGWQSVQRYLIDPKVTL